MPACVFCAAVLLAMWRADVAQCVSGVPRATNHHCPCPGATLPLASNHHCPCPHVTRSLPSPAAPALAYPRLIRVRCVPGSPATAPYCNPAYVFSAVKRLRVPSRLLACVFSRNTVTRLCFYAHCNACLYLQSVALVITVVVCRPRSVEHRLREVWSGSGVVLRRRRPCKE